MNARFEYEYVRSSWPLVDRASLQLAHWAQRTVELWDRRPNEPHGAPGAIVRRFCAAVVAGLPVFDERLRAWRDVRALDIADDDVRFRRVEDRIRQALGDEGAVAAGEGVVMVVPSLSLGGAESQLTQLALALKHRGLGVRIAVKHLGEPVFEHYRSRLESAGILVESLDDFDGDAAPPDVAVPPLDANLHRMTRILVGRLQQWRPAVVHAWMDELGAAAGLAAALCRVGRIVVDCRSLRPTWFEARGTGSIRAILSVLAARRGVSLVNNSQAGADDYRDWLRLRNTIRVVRNGLDGASIDAAVRSSPAGGVRHGPVVGGMMRLSTEKHPEMWLEVARRFVAKQPGVRFLLYGDGPMRKRLEKRIRRSGLADSVELKGWTADAPVTLAGLDALLVTSDVEGTPNVVLEAQWLGVPVVARPVGGLPEAIAPEMQRLLGRDPDALVESLSVALSMRRESVMEAGRRFVSATFDPNARLSAYLALYGYGATGAQH